MLTVIEPAPPAVSLRLKEVPPVEAALIVTACESVRETLPAELTLRVGVEILSGPIAAEPVVLNAIEVPVIVPVPVMEPPAVEIVTAVPCILPLSKMFVAGEPVAIKARVPLAVMGLLTTI